MRVYNDPCDTALHQDLQDCLSVLRTRRHFDPAAYIEEKTSELHEYFSASGLAGAVVGVSGGIDSAVVLALLHQASMRPGSPIIQITPVLLPVYDASSATGQEDACVRAHEYVVSLDLHPHVVDLTAAHQALISSVTQDSTVKTPSDWATGQLVACLRTPALYFFTSLATDAGCPTVVVGTTNRDEGSWLGFIGKASDAMVDVQLISDIHKSEVYQVARLLNVTDAIVDAAPTGDMFDGRLDVEVFGAPYDFVELYLLLLEASDATSLTEPFCDEAMSQFTQLASHLEALHAHNAHKYLAGSPAVHLDVRPAGTPGGWLDARDWRRT